MGEQRTFAWLAWKGKGKVTRRERFLAEMEAVIPWARLLALIESHYPKAGQGRQPLGREKMLRIYFLQQWFIYGPLPKAQNCSRSLVSDDPVAVIYSAS
jgi:transposase, IS5 family